ncbi:MAG TPA: enoyl-CoA hydratase/isomerase family protein [Thermoanaerobaculaceae bacterium]|nr:enoyl-CoA hydratase/isomerase family protein [Thermoanaerobaculaceae bacterium]
MALVRTQRRAGAVVVEMARADAGNALSNALVDELARAVAEPAEGARVLILTGAGRHFCAGADLAELAAGAAAGEEERVADAMRLGALYAALLRCPLLTVAAVHGAAFGGGAGLAACCDLVIAGPDARFQFSEARLGFVPALISAFLPRRVAPARLARLYLDPQPLGPEAALAAGLADEIAGEPVEAAARRASELARKVAPSAVAETKRLLLELTLPDLDARLAAAARANARQRAHPECRLGLAAFLATKSFPEWPE